MKIYRLEHKDSKIGPYISWANNKALSKDTHDLIYRMLMAHEKSKKHPVPGEDGMTISSDYVCGFKSEEDLKDWFFGFLTPLKRHGFKVVVYEVNKKDVKIGKRQVIFKRGC